jgi:hypothetical protein
VDAVRRSLSVYFGVLISKRIDFSGGAYVLQPEASHDVVEVVVGQDGPSAIPRPDAFHACADNVRYSPSSTGSIVSAKSWMST